MYQLQQEAIDFYRSRYGLTYPLPSYEDWLCQQQALYGTIASAAGADFRRPDAARIDTTLQDHMLDLQILSHIHNNNHVYKGRNTGSTMK